MEQAELNNVWRYYQTARCSNDTSDKDAFMHIVGAALTAKEDPSAKLACSDGLSLRADIMAEIEKETVDVMKSEGYTDVYKTGIIEGMRLTMVIYDQIVDKSKAR